MSKQEFLDTLRRALARELSESEVADNINYYWNYIEQQVASGKSEEQVLSELGDPRLIARTITTPAASTWSRSVTTATGSRSPTRPANGRCPVPATVAW